MQIQTVYTRKDKKNAETSFARLGCATKLKITTEEGVTITAIPLLNHEESRSSSLRIQVLETNYTGEFEIDSIVLNSDLTMNNSTYRIEVYLKGSNLKSKLLAISSLEV